MHVDRTALGDPGITPHVLEQALPREDLPRVFEKVPEQDELPGRQLEWLPVARDAFTK